MPVESVRNAACSDVGHQSRQGVRSGRNHFRHDGLTNAAEYFRGSAGSANDAAEAIEEYTFVRPHASLGLRFETQRHANPQTALDKAGWKTGRDLFGSH